ncbi:MAG: hypothetical protein IBJ00_06745, partial [Alphaproteobacteria bacterium]|nr:hypothetical protein [Alphaproteobacteria bacterium]
MNQEIQELPSQPHPNFKMANAIRVLAIDAVEKAQSGHPGMPMGMADIATVLFSEHLKFDPQNPRCNEHSPKNILARRDASRRQRERRRAAYPPRPI